MRIPIAIVIVLFVFSASRGADVMIVQDGKSEYAIYTKADASEAEQLGADELARYIKQMSGADLKVQRGGKKVPAKSIRVGVSATGGKDGDESYEITANGVFVQISGGSPRAVLHGCYELLDSLGCRFLAPQYKHYNGSAEVVPQVKTLVVTDAMVRSSAPKLKFRKLYVEEGHSHNEENLKQMGEWMSKVGFNTLVIPTDYQGSGRVKWDNWRKEVGPELKRRGIAIEVGGHGYQNFINAEMEGGKLFEQHPEWFGADAKGQRQKAKGRVICTSNAAAVDYLTANVVKYLKDRPEIEIFDFWPPDGAKWCECEKCVKLGTPSDRQAILVHHVKGKVTEARADVRMEVLAYHTSVMPPEKVKLDKDVLLDFCPIGQQFDHQIFDEGAEKNAEYVKGLQAWRKAFEGDISVYSYYRKYAWDSLPVIIPNYMQKDLQFYAKVPVQGVSVYSEPGDWFTYELNHYTLAALAWDPDVDVDNLVKKFCDARYGPEHSAAAQTVLTTLQKVTRNTSSIPHSALKAPTVIASDAAQVEVLLQSTKSEAARAEDPAVKRNLERLGLMCEYALGDLRIQKMRAEKGDAEAMKAKAVELHAFVSSHPDDGVFLVKNQRLAVGRLQKRYGIEVKPEPGEAGRAATPPVNAPE